MHEYSIVSALIDQVRQEADRQGARQVHRLRVRIGELAGVDVGLLRTAYETFRERTLCDHAELDLESVPARWSCPRCERPFPAGARLRCTRCERPARLVEGDEIILASIEMEVGDV
ncbi:MAG: hydrogenase maturation nickel metallochaperone HypA [Myxococcota bacterium]